MPRFLLVLNANVTGNYSLIGLVMLLSAIAPFIFLSKHGRTSIGITRPRNYHWILVAFIAGLFLSFLLHYVGTGHYGNSYENWYSYIGRSYKIPPGIQSEDKAILFTIMAYRYDF